jgi:hypothetical protein
VVVLLINPALGAEIRRGQQREQRRCVVGRLFGPQPGNRCGQIAVGRARRARHPGAVIFGRLIAQFLDRQIGLHLALMLDDEAQRIGGVADDGEIQPPFGEDRLGLRLLVGWSTMSMRSWLSESIIS